MLEPHTSSALICYHHKQIYRRQRMVLYKYLTPARLDVLEGRRIRFTQPAAFNDPFEFRPCIESAMAQGHLRDYVEWNRTSMRS